MRRTAMRGADQLFVTNKYLHPDLTPPEELRACPRYRILDDRLRGARLAGPDALLDAACAPQPTSMTRRAVLAPPSNGLNAVR